ncbi:hypothetical protein P775_14870 [Puniceibacterium antarcticum]|uniref:Uncharacterized protein n=1 Tax=Puniceibacterium antarcticum TaxID=1206336 RepID=A0A2G8RDC5_9RHOB|nr:HlyD family secretion protein [Puniceibacterium antarcticum]PIL19421.1 hypothetical protein P775_14870 [Puniceibacterium antarcticum]
MKKLVSVVLSLAIGIAGVGLVLYVWHLPPFTASVMTTENAYVRGKVVQIAPLVSGRIIAVTVQDFEQVEAGQVLFRIDDRQLSQRVAQAQSALDAAQADLANSQQDQATAESGVAAAKAGLASAKAGLAAAQSGWDREQALKGRGVISQADADQSRLTLDQARAVVSQAEAQIQVAEQKVKSVVVARTGLQAQVASAQAALELAQIDLDYATIRAPESGRVGQVGGRIGQYATAGTSLAALVESNVWVIANFKETQMSGMSVGQTASFAVDALQGAVFTGTVMGFSPATTSEFSVLGSAAAAGNFTKIAQRLPVRIALTPGQTGSAALAPGMSVVARVDTRQPANAYAANEQAN